MRGLCMLGLVSVAAAAGTGVWALRLIDLSKYPLATCLDGSPGGFYVMQGNAGASNKWEIHLQGGGWCESLSDCAARASGVSPYGNQPSLGGSGAWGPGPCTANLSDSTPPCVADGGSGGIMSNDAAVNPQLASWTKVWLGYCDGGSFAGTLVEPVHVNATAVVHFRGAYILDAAIDTLLHSLGMAAATDVLLKGCSAGGLAAFIHADRVGAAVAAANPATRYTAQPGAGFILDFPSFFGPNIIEPVLQWVFAAQGANASGNAACVAAYRAQQPGSEWHCMFPQFVLPFLKTPIFVSNSLGDAAQLVVVMALPCDPAAGSCSASELAYFDSFRAGMLAALLPVLRAGSAHGGWLVECFVHMVENVDRAWAGIRVAGQTQADTFAAWYGAGSIAVVGAQRTAVDLAWTNGTGTPYGGNPDCGMYGPVPSQP